MNREEYSFPFLLDKLGVAHSIVNALILGGLALIFGLAFGLGEKSLRKNISVNLTIKWTKEIIIYKLDFNNPNPQGFRIGVV